MFEIIEFNRMTDYSSYPSDEQESCFNGEAESVVEFFRRAPGTDNDDIVPEDTTNYDEEQSSEAHEPIEEEYSPSELGNTYEKCDNW